MTTFESLNIPKIILDTLGALQYTTPTPIQEAVIPLALAGDDVLGSAQTGTGKTAAFGIPAIAHMMQNNKNAVLVLLPTRELAAQVLNEIVKIMGKSLSFRTALLIGGDSMPKQIRQIKQPARLIVGTPGRINDHINQGNLKLGHVNMLILDETDRMLDMGFGNQLKTIIERVSNVRQTLMLSATFPKNIMELAGKYLRDPKRVSVGNENVVTDNITQDTVFVTDDNKYEALVEILRKQTGSVLVFTKTKYGAERLMKKLNKDDFLAGALHGDLSQGKRSTAISQFRNQKFNIMVATDIAARGLDISHIGAVINFDLPQAAEDYIHRIGRTARAGASGIAINLLTEKDYGKWLDICKLLKTEPNLPAGAKIIREVKSLSRGGGRPHRPGRNFSPKKSK